MIGNNLQNVNRISPALDARLEAAPPAAPVLDLLKRSSVETRPGDRLPQRTGGMGRTMRAMLRVPGGSDPSKVIRLANRVHKNGFNPVPYIVATDIADESAIRHLLDRMTLNNEVEELIVFSGDTYCADGNCWSALDVLKSGVFNDYNIKRIGVIGFPEGHPVLPDELLFEHLYQKQRFATFTGIDVFILTQLCFDANRIMRWERHLRDIGIDLPLRIGLPGVSSMEKLVGFAKSASVGSSVRHLLEETRHAQPKAIYFPIRELVGLSSGWRSVGTDRIEGVHFFPMESASRTVSWLDSIWKANTAESRAA